MPLTTTLLFIISTKLEVYSCVTSLLFTSWLNEFDSRESTKIITYARKENEAFLFFHQRLLTFFRSTIQQEVMQDDQDRTSDTKSKHGKLKGQTSTASYLRFLVK